MRRFAFVLVLTFVATFVPASAIQPIPNFEPSPQCPFTLPDGFEVECGFVTVFETRDPARADDSNIIQLAVAIIRSFSDNPAPDPVFYLEGGPGGHVVEFANFYAEDMRDILEERDVILFDQRGMGLSQPGLDCPAFTNLEYDLLDQDMSDAEALALAYDTLLACRADYVAAGANLSAYTSAQNAADIADIASALGYDQINLFGISYGTKLALTTMRDYPALVRSAALDAVYPLAINSEAEFLRSADRAFSTLFAACAADDVCDERYAELERVFYATVERLNAAPEALVFFDPYTETERTILVNGDLLISALFSSLYQTPAIADLPEAIYRAADGNYDFFLDEVVFNIVSGDFFSEGAFFNYTCYEEDSFTTLDEIIANAAGLPEQLRDFGLEASEVYLNFCDTWTAGATVDPIENEAVISEIPALLMVGEYDPITPPAFAEGVAQNLSRSRYYEFAGVGHSVWYGSPCGRDLVVQFINDPAGDLNDACVSQLEAPVFALPLISEVRFVTATDPERNIAYAIPLGWFQEERTIFNAFSDADLPTFGYRFPESIESYVEDIIIEGAYGYAQLPSPVDTVTSNDLVWDLYEVQNEAAGVYATFAFTTNSSGDAYVIVVVASSADERATLTAIMLRPALEAFTER